MKNVRIIKLAPVVQGSTTRAAFLQGHGQELTMFFLEFSASTPAVARSWFLFPTTPVVSSSQMGVNEIHMVESNLHGSLPI